MKKSNDNKKQQLKKVATATAITVTLATSNVPTLAYGMELEANANEEVVTEQVEASEVITEEVAVEEVATEEVVEEIVTEEEVTEETNAVVEEIPVQEEVVTLEEEVETKEEVAAKNTVKSTVSGFNLNDWDYNSYIGTIVLTKYNGDAKDIVIPGKVHAPAGTNPQGQAVPEGFKQVKIGTLDSSLSNDCFAGNRSQITSLKFVEVDGVKAQLPTPSTNTINNAFKNFTSLKSIDLSGVDLSLLTDMTNMFNGCTSLKEVNLSGITISSEVKSMSQMFSGFGKLKNVNLSNIDTKNVEEIYNMFNGCTALEEVNLQGFNTTGITNMTGMFLGCSNLHTIKFDNAFDTSSVKTINNMFKDCSSLKSVDLSNFNTSNATNMSYMFSDSGLENLDLSNFNTSSATNMKGMFRNTPNLKSINFGANFNTSSVKDMSFMFCNSGVSNLDLSGFDTSKVTDMTAMFGSLDNIDILDLSNFTFGANVKMRHMFAKHISVASANNNIVEDSTYTKKEFIVISSDQKIKNYNFEADYCLPLKVTLDANTGEFANGETVIELKINVLKTLDKTILERELNNILEQAEPSKNEHSFISWNKTKDDKYDIVYVAEWKVFENPDADFDGDMGVNPDLIPDKPNYDVDDEMGVITPSKPNYDVEDDMEVNPDELPSKPNYDVEDDMMVDTDKLPSYPNYDVEDDMMVNPDLIPDVPNYDVDDNIGVVPDVEEVLDGTENDDMMVEVEEDTEINTPNQPNVDEPSADKPENNEGGNNTNNNKNPDNPQTGDGSIIGPVMVAVMSLFGLLSMKKRRGEE